MSVLSRLRSFFSSVGLGRGGSRESSILPTAAAPIYEPTPPPVYEPAPFDPSSDPLYGTRKEDYADNFQDPPPTARMRGIFVSWEAAADYAQAMGGPGAAWMFLADSGDGGVEIYGVDEYETTAEDDADDDGMTLGDRLDADFRAQFGRDMEGDND